MAAQYSENFLILLGAASYPLIPVVNPKQASAFHGSQEVVLSDLVKYINVTRCLDLFNSPKAAALQIEEIREFLRTASAPSGSRLFIYYIGHGILDRDNIEEYYLACQTTTQDSYLNTAIRIRTLGQLLSCVGTSLDVVVIIDSCFAARALHGLQVTCRSLALLAATSRHEGAVAPPAASRTQFTDCLYQTLQTGSPKHGRYLSLDNLAEILRIKQKELYPESGATPELHAPKHGPSGEDPRHAQIFPNFGYQSNSSSIAPEGRPFLLIKIEPELRHRSRRGYRIKAWMLNTETSSGYLGDLIWDTESNGDNELVYASQLPMLLQRLYRDAGKWLLTNQVYQTDYWIEIIAPRELLSERYDQLPTPTGSLGARQHVVVRSLERLQLAPVFTSSSSSRSKLKGNSRVADDLSQLEQGPDEYSLLLQYQRWASMQSIVKKQCMHMIDLAGDAVWDQVAEGTSGARIRANCPPGGRLLNLLMKAHGRAVVWALLEKAPLPHSTTEDAFSTLLKAGVPIMIWTRGDMHTESIDILCRLLKEGSVHEIPTQVRDIRSSDADGEKELGSAITLFWDNPNRLPKSHQMTHPTRRK